jgi:hypothetical protein|nr:DUF3502 domain-containing protein [uncultured Blautia sp.]
MKKTNIIRKRFWILVCAILLICIWGVFTIKWYKESKLITLYWDTPFYISAKTTELLNEELQKSGYNVKIEFKYIEFENYYDEVFCDIDEGNVDILFSGLISWQKIGKRNIFIEQMQTWNDFFQSEQGDKLYQAFPNVLWEAMEIDGQSYFICCGGNAPNQSAIRVSHILGRQYGISAEELAYDDIISYIPLFLENSPVEDTYFIQYPSCLLSNVPGYTFVCSPFVPLLIREDAKGIDVEYLYEIPEFVSLYEALQELNDSGLIAPGDYESQENVLFKMISYRTAGDLDSIGLDTEDLILMETEYVYPLELTGNCVGVVKERPNTELAQQVLSEIYTNEKIANLLVYGEGNVDYRVQNGHAVTCNSMEYVNPYPVAGNLYLSLPSLYQSENKNSEYWAELYSKKLSEIHGFVFDGTEVEEELEAVTSIMFRFYECDNNLDIFQMDITELATELKNAGIEKIQKEVERQLSVWFAEKEKNGDG